MKLTDEIIAAAATPANGAKKLTDGKGLFLLIQSRGRPSWRMKYAFAGAEKSISFGPYGHAKDEVPIDRARELAEEARGLLAENPPRDPVEVRRLAATEQVRERVTTFGTVGTEFLGLNDAHKARTKYKHSWLFALLAPLHTRPIASIEPPDILKVLRKIEAQDKREAAHRASQFAARVFRYAIQIGALRGKVNPAADLRGALKPVQVESRAAITDPATFGLLMKVIDSVGDGLGYASVTAALQLLARTALRPGELRRGLWSEINFEKAEWRIPAERMKMNRPHLVPLSTQCVAILKALQEITGDGALIFEGQRPGAELSDNAMRKRIHLIFPPAMHSLHGFRSSFSTMMNERGVDSQLIELQLSHRKRDAIASIYDRGERVPERRKLMQDWSDYIDELRGFPRTWT